MASILVTGIAGGLAQCAARKLMAQGNEVTGVDYRKVQEELPPNLKVYQAHYNKTIIEDIFRHHRFDAVLHLGRVGNLKEGIDKRFDLNVIGSQKIMNLCVTNHVKSLVVLSTFHIYGAHPANHIPIGEEDPLRAGVEFPQIGDAIQLDNMASTWVYRHPGVRTSVLRPVNVIGPDISNAMSQFLRMPRVPYLMGFNPMVQFIYQDDLADAILAALDQRHPGVYNISGDDVIPWRTALELAQARTYPLPGFMVNAYLRIKPGFPPYLVNFFRYPSIVSDALFRARFNWKPAANIQDSLWRTVAAAREDQWRAREKPAL